MTYEEIVIGFDVREMWLSYPDTDRWTPEYRQHLIRQEIVKPLAFDRMIWPSIFVPNFMIIGGTGFEKIPGVDVNLEIPGQYKTYDGFWRELVAMQNGLIQNPTYLHKPRWVVALTLLVNSEEAQESLYVYPSKIEDHWSLLGYDVCYYDHWSTLYLHYDDNLPQLREQYGSFLNQYHLLTNHYHALAFAEWKEKDEPGRIPYSIYGLYHVESLDGAGLPYAS